MTLENFMQDFLSRPMSALRTIEHRNSGNRTSTILAREDNFQCELITWGPNLVLPAHRHPNLRGIALRIDGDMTFIIGPTENRTNELIKRASVWKGKFLKGRNIQIEPGDWHGGKTGGGGASFFAFQEWMPGSILKAASQDWVGGKIPEATLSKICG